MNDRPLRRDSTLVEAHKPLVLFARAASGPEKAPPRDDAAHSLIARFPQPAFLLAADGDILTASAEADALVAQTDEIAAAEIAADGDPGGWWQALTAWALDGEAPGSGSLNTVIPGAGEEGTDRMLEWRALAMEGGTVAVFAQDFSLHHTLNQALADSRHRFRELTELAADFAWECDAAGCLSYVSSKGALGYLPRDLIGRPGKRLLAEQLIEDMDPFETRVEIQSRDVWMVRADGETVTQTVWARPVLDKDGQWRGARGVCRDVSRSRRLEQQIARAQMRERLLAHILKSMRDELRPERSLATAVRATVHAIAAAGAAVFHLGADGLTVPVASFSVRAPDSEGDEKLVQALPQLVDISAQPTNLPSRHMLEDVEAKVAISQFRGQPVGLLAVWRRSGEGHPCVWDEDDDHVIQAVADQLGLAHEQRAHYRELESLAQRDGLTGLYNRRTLLERVGSDFAIAPPDRMQAIAYVDIDNFKGINDHYGHQEGDIIIQAVARTILRLTGAADIAARIGGDEFVVWLGDTTDEAVDAFARNVQLGGREIAGSYSDVAPPGLSVGVAVRDNGSDETLEGLIARADRMMYEAKRGKSKVRSGRVRISRSAEDR